VTKAAKSLSNYRYMVGMERLDSYKNKLAEYGSFAEAVKTVRENLAKSAGKTAKVYEIVMPDRRLAVFGVAMNDGESTAMASGSRKSTCRTTSPGCLTRFMCRQ
jgi:hypothetical protein